MWNSTEPEAGRASRTWGVRKAGNCGVGVAVSCGAAGGGWVDGSSTWEVEVTGLRAICGLPHAARTASTSTDTEVSTYFNCGIGSGSSWSGFGRPASERARSIGPPFARVMCALSWFDPTSSGSRRDVYNADGYPPGPRKRIDAASPIHCGRTVGSRPERLLCVDRARPHANARAAYRNQHDHSHAHGHTQPHAARMPDRGGRRHAAHPR